MANKHDPTAKRTAMKLGGKNYLLVLDFNAISAYEDVTGKKFTNLDFADLGVRDMHALIYGAMQTEHPEVTFRDVGGWIGFDNLRYVGEKMVDLLKNSVPDREEEGESPLAEEAVTATESTG